MLNYLWKNGTKYFFIENLQVLFYCNILYNIIKRVCFTGRSFFYLGVNLWFYCILYMFLTAVSPLRLIFNVVMN